MTDEEIIGQLGTCYRHGAKKCQQCISRMKNSTALVQIASNQGDFSERNKYNIQKNFQNSVDFIKAGLDMSDEEIDKLKVADMEKHFHKAETEITVGKMKKFMKIEKGVTRGLISRIKMWLNQ